MTLAELGEIFKNARLKARLTQQDIASLTGISRYRVSLFETGNLTELGTVKLLNLLAAVGLDLFVRPPSHRRTLDDVIAESESDTGYAPDRRRVRKTRRSTVSIQAASAIDEPPASGRTKGSDDQ